MASTRLTISLLIGLSCGSPASGLVTDQQPESSFRSFIRRYNRPYQHGTQEYKERFALFSGRAAKVQAHNSLPKRLWTAGINELSDRTEAELAQLRGWRGGALPAAGHAKPSSPSAAGTILEQNMTTLLPRECMNWTTLRSLSQIRDQGGCGSCWAVASVTVLNAHSEIYSAGQQARSFSIQELVDCVPNPNSCGGTGGCAGATVELAYNYAINNGLGSDVARPYLGATGTCLGGPLGKQIFLSQANEDLASPGVHTARALAKGSFFGMKAWERLPENAYEPLMRAVYERGPVAISVAASSWNDYSSGIFDGCQKDAVIDHAVTLIGYGEDTVHQEKFWLVQNSWGPYWGEAGRIRLLRTDSDDDTEHCGVDHQPELGTGCKGGPTEVKVCGMCGILYDSVVPHFQ